MKPLLNRYDLLYVFNAAHFTLRHYAKGYYPLYNSPVKPLSVNRLFFPLENPNGAENFIADSFKQYELVPGSMYFVPAFLPSRFRLDDQLLFLSIQTNLEIFPGVELFSGCPRMVVLPAPCEFAQLMKIFDSNNPELLYLDAVKAGSLVFSIMGQLLEHYAPEDFWKPLALRRYADLTDYLNQNGNALTSVAELANVKRLSRENFTRHFTADTGITPKQLIDRFVMGRCLALVSQGLKFKDISHRLKFRDEFAFSRYFKRNMGESPREWRRNSHPHSSHSLLGQIIN